MRVLVTGGAGYIGSHACKALAASGYHPVVFDNLSTGHADNVRWGELVQGDILDMAAIEAAMTDHQPEAVMHFAASAYVGESVTAPEKYYRNNIVGSLNLLDAMLKHRIGMLVFSSTCATYGIPEKLPITETSRQSPINPYGFTKLAIERAIADYGAAHGLRWCSLRYFNAAGADPDGELGEWHDPETHVIPLAIEAALGRREALRVFGTDYATPDGTAIRDYIHVSDLADAHVKAIAYLKGGGSSAPFNLATGQGTSVFELIKAVSSAVGRETPHSLHDRRAGDPPVLFATAESANRQLGWQPRFRTIGEIVSTAARWHMR